MDKPLLNKRIFWDTDFEKIDYQKNAASIVERVFERGDVEDIRQVRRFYGDEKVKDILINAKWLSNIKLYLAAAIFNTPISKFKCYTQNQSMKELWNY